jgi:hypothetical protein
MNFRVSGCYWSKGQFRNRGNKMLASFLWNQSEQLIVPVVGGRNFSTRHTTICANVGLLEGWQNKGEVFEH